MRVLNDNSDGRERDMSEPRGTSGAPDAAPPEPAKNNEKKIEFKEIKEIKEFKIEKNEKIEKSEFKDFKDHKHEKLEKNENKEHKDAKHEKIEKPEAKEIAEKPVGKEKDGKEIAEGPQGPGGPVEQRLAMLEQSVASMQHFITLAQRPDLSRGALSGEPTAGATGTSTGRERSRPSS